MSLFDRMKDSVSSAGVGVSQKFSYTADIMKLNNQIRNNEREIEKLVAQVGQRCMELHLSEENSEYEDLFAKIRQYKAENENYQGEIQRLTEENQEQARLRQIEMQQKQEQREKERREREAARQQEASLRQQEMQGNTGQMMQVCPKCGQWNDGDSKFCVHCGSILSNVPQAREKDPMAQVCPKCGQQNDTNSKFCVYCGNPLVNEGMEFKPAQQDEPLEPTDSIDKSDGTKKGSETNNVL